MSNYAELAKDARAIADRITKIPDGWSGEDEVQMTQNQAQDLADALGDALEQLHQEAADTDTDTDDEDEDEDGDE